MKLIWTACTYLPTDCVGGRSLRIFTGQTDTDDDEWWVEMNGRHTNTKQRDVSGCGVVAANIGHNLFASPGPLMRLI